MSMERPSKRLRTIPPPPPDDRHNGYLDSVPDEVLRIVLRYLSRRPAHEKWHAYISAHSVDTALHVGGALERVASMEFHGIGGLDGIPSVTNLDVEILRSLVSRLPLRSLDVQLPGENFLSDILLECVDELRELVLDTAYIAMTQNDILAISMYCTKLSRLQIRGTRIEGPLTPIWRSLGSTLTGIYIARDYSAAGYRFPDIASVHDLVKHCVNLDRVVVQTLNYHTVDILVALGSRIRVLGIMSPSTVMHKDWGLWRIVCGACTNLGAVHLAVLAPWAVDILSAMRTKVVALTLYYMNYLIPPVRNRFFSVLSHCSVLKRVRLFVCKFPLQVLRQLFESLISVSTMTCEMNNSYVKPKDIVDVIARNLRNLDTLTLITQEPLKGEDVKALAGLPRLKSVRLECKLTINSVSVSKPSECAVEAVKMFKDCAQLVRLEISGIIQLYWYRHQLAEAAAMYKRKDFDMFIGGVQFRTW